MLTDTGLPEITARLLRFTGEINARLAGLSDEELLEVMAAYEEVGRVLSAVQVRVAAEVGARSPSEFGNEG